MIVGAEARDLIHASRGHTGQLRSTSDLDLGIAVHNWTDFDMAVERYELVGSNGIRRDVQGVPVDFIPFGDVESPPGSVLPATRSDPIIVFGFQEAFDGADELPLPSGATVRIPTPAGFALLKMRAWLDRLSFADKDARDLAVAAYWYMSDERVLDRAFDESRMGQLEAVDFDGDLAAVQLLGEDIGSCLGTDARHDLCERWNRFDPDLDLIVPFFTFGSSDPIGRDLFRRRQILERLIGGLSVAP